MSEKWTPPSQLPDIREAEFIGIDSETKDINLMTMGPGAPRGDAHAIGFSLATNDGFKCYLPIRHEGGGNLDIEPVLRYIKDMVSSNSVKVGANIQYDMEILRVEGIEVLGPIADIQIGEPLLDEDLRSYSLENLGKLYFGEGKEEELLNEVADNLGIDRRSVKSILYKLPASLVGPYAEQDAVLTLKIWLEQKKRLELQGLIPIFELEMDVIRVLIDMRFRGVPVNVQRAEELEFQLAQEQREVEHELKRLSGSDIDIWSNISIANAAHSMGLEVPLTELNNPSFDAEFLSKQEHLFFKALLKCRKLDRAGSVFIRSKILDYQKNGLVFPRFRQVRGDDKGTKGGRFSSEGPNFQQVPARDEYLAPLVRSIYEAHEGCKWASFDFKAQEPRITAHYGFILGLRSADKIKARYDEDPFTDFHNETASLIKVVTGKIITRKNAKDINLGIAYGMGKKKLAESLGLPMNEAYDVLEAYDIALPFVKQLGSECIRIAERRGFIKTILGRHKHFNLFGPRRWTKGIVPKKQHEAIKEFGENIVRYFTYKGLNALIQGSSADQIKKAMVECWKKGHTPYLTIHDELIFPIHYEKEIEEIAYIMCSCIPQFTIPMASDIEIGPNWGNVTDEYSYSVQTGLISR
jgi:DNA polymerase I-like protein with 3'-5' exonuclease and polymerase domains